MIDLNNRTQVTLSGVSLRGVIRACGLFVCILLAVGVAGYAMWLPFQDLTDPIHARLYAIPRPYFLAHTFGGAFALLIIPLQFWLLKRNRVLHRIFGRIYVASVCVSAIGGYYMAMEAFGGFISTLGLTVLASLWWSFTVVAACHAILGNIAQHREWMIRSIAMTGAAVTLRLISPFVHMALDEVTAQQTVYWISWMINWAIAEWWIRRRPMRPNLA